MWQTFLSRKMKQPMMIQYFTWFISMIRLIRNRGLKVSIMISQIFWLPLVEIWAFSLACVAFLFFWHLSIVSKSLSRGFKNFQWEKIKNDFLSNLTPNVKKNHHGTYIYYKCFLNNTSIIIWYGCFTSLNTWLVQKSFVLCIKKKLTDYKFGQTLIKYHTQRIANMCLPFYWSL